MKKLLVIVAMIMAITPFVSGQKNPGINSEWVKVIEGEGNSSAKRAISDGEAIYFSGDYVGNGQQFGDIELPVMGGGITGLVTKLSKEGNIEWTLSFMGNNMDVILDLAIADDGNLLVLGWTASDVMYLDGEQYPNSSSLTANMFIAKVDKDGGNVIWIKETESDELRSVWSKQMDVSNDGSIYLTGVYDGNFTFQDETLTSVDYIFQDVFVMKLDRDGNLIWMKGFEGEGSQSPHGMKVSSDNSIFFCIDYEKPIEIGGEMLPFEGSENYWSAIVKLDSNGEPVKFVGYGNEFYPTGSRGLEIDANDNLYCGVLFSEFIGVAGKEIVSIGEQNTVIIKFDKDLNYLAERVFGTSNYDQIFGMEQGNGYIYASVKYATSDDFICNISTKEKIDKVSPGCGGFAIVAYDYDLNFVCGNSFNSQNLRESTINPPIRFGIVDDYIYLGSDYSGDNELILGEVYTTEPEHGNAYMMKYKFIGNTNVNEIIENSVNVNLYPNPASSTITIDIDETIIEYSVYTISGQKVEVEMNNKQMNVSALQSGLYIINIITDNGTVNRSFVKK